MSCAANPREKVKKNMKIVEIGCATQCACAFTSNAIISISFDCSRRRYVIYANGHRQRLSVMLQCDRIVYQCWITVIFNVARRAMIPYTQAYRHRTLMESMWQSSTMRWTSTMMLRWTTRCPRPRSNARPLRKSIRVISFAWTRRGVVSSGWHWYAERSVQFRPEHKSRCMTASQRWRSERNRNGRWANEGIRYLASSQPIWKTIRKF